MIARYLALHRTQFSDALYIGIRARLSSHLCEWVWLLLAPDMARLPWLSVGSSCSELDSSSSVSLLRSIYGSQVSRVLLASDDDLGPQHDRWDRELPNCTIRRPKSSPAVSRIERQNPSATSDRVSRFRPSTARSPAAPLQGGGAAVRPRSAFPVSFPRSALGSATPLLFTAPCIVISAPGGRRGRSGALQNCHSRDEACPSYK